MVLKKLRFSIHIILLAMLFVFQSCERNEQNNSRPEQDVTAINNLLAIGQKHYQNEEFDSSYYYYNKAKDAAELQKDTSRIIHSISWIAQIQRNRGDYSGSETTSIEALPFIEQPNKYPYGETNIYIGLGNNYFLLHENDNAIYYFKKAINSKTDEDIKSGILNNISKAYIEKGDYQRAIQTLLPLTLKRESINNPITYANINGNLGDAYTKSGQPQALYYLNKALKIREKMNDNWNLIGSYYNLSGYYKTKNFNLSNKYALLGYKKSTKLKSVDSRLECLRLLIQNSSGNLAKKYSLQYLHIDDSIRQVRQQAKNQFAKIKYDFKKEKQENIELKAQKIIQLQQQKNKNLLIYFIVVIAFVIALFTYYYLSAKNKREKLKSSYNTEIRIAKKLHDELANDVYQTMTFAETQDLSTTQNKETLLNNLDTIYSRTRNISQENSVIETGPYFLPNIKEMMSAFNTDNTHIIINGMETVNWSIIDKSKKITLYRVIQELLVNMKKHSKSSLVLLSFNVTENKMHLNYTDNGLGVPFDKINLKNGLQNVENRIHAIKGTITFDNQYNKGFKVDITFPI